jgi:N-acetylglucosaminyldiphosphoundecaprenol N-acetyl-beta-D-mannosaminyltransferase
MEKVNILGVEINDISRAQALARVRNFILDRFQHYVVTPNPEIVLAAKRDHYLRTILNHADLSLPDGIGLKIGARVLGQKLHHRTPGSDFVEALAGLAEQENWTMFLLGGLNEKVAEQAAWRLRYKHKNLKIVGHASGGMVEFKHGRMHASDEKLLKKINDSKAQIILVGFGCPKQEKWIFQNLDKLPAIKVAMTIGGTLDFLAGERKRAIYILRRIGLEWLWRLIQQPSRIKRIWNATAVFVWTALIWRFRMLLIYRKNVAACIINNNDEFLLIQRADSKESHWQFPQGGVDRGESIDEAVLREVAEETGIRTAEIINSHHEQNIYEFPSVWHKQHNGYKGQQQTIVYLKYEGDSSHIVLDEHEASRYSWVHVNDVVDMVYERRKEMAKKVVEGYHLYVKKQPTS